MLKQFKITFNYLIWMIQTISALFLLYEFISDIATVLKHDFSVVYLFLILNLIHSSLMTALVVLFFLGRKIHIRLLFSAYLIFSTIRGKFSTYFIYHYLIPQFPFSGIIFFCFAFVIDYFRYDSLKKRVSLDARQRHFVSLANIISITIGIIIHLVVAVPTYKNFFGL